MKIITKALILGSLLVSGTVFAQQASTPTTAVLPTAPTPPAIVTTSPNENDAAALQTTNKVYINQAGGSVNVNIQQTGTADIVGTLVDPIYLRGDNQAVTVVQTGNTNSILMGIIGNTGTGSGTTATIQQLGNNNTADIRCGTYTGDASCNKLTLNYRFNGNSNSVAAHVAGANITSTINADGNNNAYTLTDTSPNSSQTLLYTGSTNTTNITQTDAGGTYGHSLRVELTGSSNTVTAQQYGATETIVNIKSVGSNGQFNIKSGH